MKKNTPLRFSCPSAPPPYPPTYTINKNQNKIQTNQNEN